VAEEVRNLAARSANAAKETTEMIEGSIKKVEAGTKLAMQTADALEKIVAGTTEAASLIKQIDVASNEQATGLAQINQAVMQVSEVIQKNSAVSEQSATASKELAGQAEMMRESVGKFQLKLDKDVTLNVQTNAARESDAKDIVAEKPNEKRRATITLSDEEFGKY
jgi:methyl-accepting chemotaxis protein